MSESVQHENLFYNYEIKEYFFKFSDKFLKNDMNFVIDDSIINISIKSSVLCKIIEIYPAFVLSIKKIELDVDDKNATIVEQLNNLEYLLLTECTDVDFSNFVSLKQLYFTYSKSYKGLDKLNKIEVLSVYNANHFFLNSEIFKNYKELKKIQIVQSRLADFYFLQNLESIEKVEISFVKDYLDLFQLLPLKNLLKEIRFNNSKNIVGYDILKKLTQLETIVFSDCNEISNSSFVDYLPNLKQLTVVGKSFFVDGNINNLQKNGLTIGIDNKKNYTLKSNAFLNYFRNPPVPML